jgi:hypothetical protein
VDLMGEIRGFGIVLSEIDVHTKRLWRKLENDFVNFDR